MNLLFAALSGDPNMKRLKNLFAAKKKQDNLVYGLTGSQKHAAFALCAADYAAPIVIICRNEGSVERWREDLQNLLPDKKVAVLPEIDFFADNAAVKGKERIARRLETLSRLQNEPNFILLAAPAAAAAKDPDPNFWTKQSIALKTGGAFPMANLAAQLTKLGYERGDEAENLGEFCVRGGLMDVFPVNAANPYRIEFFDDEVESIRAIDPFTKRSKEKLAELSILPLRAEGKANLVPFTEYAGGAIIFDEPNRIREETEKIVKEDPNLKSAVFSYDDILNSARSRQNIFYFTLMLQKLPQISPAESIGFTMISMTAFRRQMDILTDELKRRLKEKNAVYILAGSREKADALYDFCGKKRLPRLYAEKTDALPFGKIVIDSGSIINGFENPAARLTVIAAAEIFGAQKRIQPAAKKNAITLLDDIAPGDYVVHSAHGIGKYVGVETIEVNGVRRDYLHIKYGGDDKLFVPTDQVGLLQKYIGAEGQTPRLNRMSGTEWAKAKAKAKKAAADIADKLLKIYAERKNAKGFAFSPDDSYMREFEEAFPFEETADQLRAIADIKRDMEREKPMDRLICGDVGFGKTEVAIRAAYKAAMDGKQTAVLVPTTVLAEQHYQTFTARFADFAPTVGVVCRFRSLKEQRETLKKTAEGKIDILIGTHAILNTKKVAFKDLGLLIIDEEQRFGVRQKEKIRSIAAGIDILSLSATPIPRTLHMSLAGARDMSLIETPIAERLPVQTYVLEDNNALIADAIKREIKRGGQAYFVYNNIANIDKMRERLENLVPEARIQTAHGQMNEAILERVMMDFFDGNANVLLATGIIENGLDVANANTIIIYDADKFGLSQLYQMRGRVGRSHRLAFAYFVYRADKALTETAEKRLQTMKEFAELGAGYKIAMKDLSIRGAGNLLGSEQHGHIAGVGFRMYCKMLEEASRALQSGQKEIIKEEATDPVIEMKIDAYIDGDYINDAMHKIEVYRRIADIKQDEEIPALIEELTDRFGKPGKSVLGLLAVAKIKNIARRLGVKSIVQQKDALEISLNEENNVNPQRMAEIGNTFGRNVLVLPAKKMLRFRYGTVKRNILGYAERILGYLAGQGSTA